MFRLPRLFVVAIVAALALVIAIPLVALAHESRDVGGGKYKFVVGWAVEPAYLGQKNGMSLAVTTKDGDKPVEGLEKTLKAEIVTGGQKREVPLKAVFRTPGSYTSDIVPTKEGDYRFRFFGTIDGVPVDETFDSANGKFNGVQSIDAIQFPAGAASAAVSAEAFAAAEQKAAAAQSALATTQMIAIAGLVFGVLGLAVGVWALMSSRRAQAGAAVPSPSTTGR